MTMILSMAGVWATVSGEEVEATERVKVGGGAMPDGTVGIFYPVKAELADSKLYDAEGKQTEEVEEIVKIQWKCAEGHTPTGGDISGRTVFQKVRLWAEDEAKCDAARRMFASIDLLVNGGKLREAQAEIDNETLQELLDADGEAMLTIGMFKGRNGGSDGNFVAAIAPAEDYEPYEAEEQPKEEPKEQPKATGRTTRRAR